MRAVGLVIEAFTLQNSSMLISSLSIKQLNEYSMLYCPVGKLLGHLKHCSGVAKEFVWHQ